jgi:hypothetical protein
MHLSVLGSGGETRAAFATSLGRDIREMARFASGHGDRVAVDQLEVKLPALKEPDLLVHVVGDAIDSLSTLSPVPPLPFFECSLLEGWRDRLPTSVEAIASVARTGHPVGVKIRCGGTSASAVPSPAAVAAAISTCRRAALPVKATQGLHHPLRHFDVDLETTVHGFLNLFIGGALSLSRTVSDDGVLEVLGEEDASAFSFSDDTIAWKGHELDLERIAAGRRHAVTSFGSCSFVEPRDDMIELGLLDPAQPEPEEAQPS